MLTRDELSRYSRNIFLREVGREGQERLKSSRVAVVGAGGLASPVLLYLAAAGVGRISVVDSDVLELTNLQRQVIFTTDDVGRPKAEAAAEHLEGLNPGVEVQAVRSRLTPENATGLLRGHDLIVETSDNFETKFLVNDTAIHLATPLILAGILRFDGQVMVIDVARGGGCYRCLFEDLPPADLVPDCSSAGVLGAVAGVVGALQAVEALKVLTGAGQPLFGQMLVMEFLTGQFRRIALPSNPACPTCARG
ncbi:MAG: HesA/MoeB/ThiF family protein [Spirochaetales bacterium]|nr:HesA/MoeB/ThiF family protein [Leptospiraceae bacterium]MCP5480937.1 HesA/MoeB/ThiF family protein [Spirochaetales bacterium]MCP5485317.1 HesA/MoeB/ThiF family protein [Spirochaetales bacterium]